MWVNCSLFGKLAESLEPYLLKGKKVFVAGELSVRTYLKDGAAKASVELNVNQIELLSPKEQQEERPARRQAPEQQGFGSDDDIPF